MNTVGSTTSVTSRRRIRRARSRGQLLERLAGLDLSPELERIGPHVHRDAADLGNTSLTAGGTYTLTLAYPLANSSSGAYTSYQIIGTNVPLSSSGLADVWRLYNVTDPARGSRRISCDRSRSRCHSWWRNGTSALLTNYPMMMVTYSGSGTTPPFTVDPVNGQILFVRPVVELGNSPTVLATGGSGVAVPDSIYGMLAYSRGAMTTVYPPDSSGPVYSGTAYTVGGLERTQVCDVDNWTYQGNASVVNGLAQMIQTSTRDTVIDATVDYKGWWTTPIDPSGGHLLNFAGNGYTTGDESLNISLRGYTVRYHTDGGDGLIYSTHLRVSSRKDMRTAESQYTHLSALGSGSMFSLASSGFQSFAPSIGANLDGVTTGQDVGGELDARNVSIAAGTDQSAIRDQLERRDQTIDAGLDRSGGGDESERPGRRGSGRRP